jgi:hypothetical protein
MIKIMKIALFSIDCIGYYMPLMIFGVLLLLVGLPI